MEPIENYRDHPSLKYDPVERIYLMRGGFYLANAAELVQIFPERLRYTNQGEPYRELARLEYRVYSDDRSSSSIDMSMEDAVRLAHRIGSSGFFVIDAKLEHHKDYQCHKARLFG